MRLRSTLLLLAVLLGLGGYVYWVELPQAEQEAKKKTLFDIKADDVTELSLTYQDRDISLKKSGAEWRMVKPLDVAADATAVKSIISGIAECEVKKDLAETASDLAAYGLDKPFLTAKFSTKDKELPAVAIGKNTPVGSNTYVQKLDDKKVLLANSSCRSSADKQVNDLRDKTILSVADTDVQKIVLQGSDSELELTRKGDAWQIDKPAAYAADAATVRSFLSTLRNMRAVDFPAAAEPAKFGLDKPRLKITLYVGKDNAEKQILIGGDNPDKKTEFYLQTSGNPTVYSVNDWVWRDLNKALPDFRDKTVLAFDRSKLQGVEVRRSDANDFKLAGNDKDGWHPEGIDGKPSATAINQWIGDLHDLKGYEIVADKPTSLAPFGLEQPMLVASLRGEGDAVLGSILIGEQKNDQGVKEYFAFASGGPTVFKIRDYLITRLNKQAQDFLEKPTPTPGGPTPAAAMIPPGMQPGLPPGVQMEDVEGLDTEEQ